MMGQSTPHSTANAIASRMRLLSKKLDSRETKLSSSLRDLSRSSRLKSRLSEKISTMAMNPTNQ